MRSIGVRELRQQASRYLREVEAGATVEITDRGRPVALLVPVPAGGTLARLVASGRLAPAEGDLLELGEPLEPEPGIPLPGEELARLRESER
jgi:prevent-host-death family protein